MLSRIVQVTRWFKEADQLILFGSRARGDHQRASDIDIAVVDAKWSRRDTNLLRHLLNESVPTLARIEVLNFHELSNDDLKRRIIAEGTVIYGKSQKS